MRWRIVAVFAGLVLGCVAVFAKAADDVTERNGLTRHDVGVLQRVVDARAPFVVHLAQFTTTLGSYPLLIVFTAVAAGLLWWRGAKLAIALTPVAALIVAGVAVSIFKPYFDRARPPASLRLVPVTDLSFPSGHATNSTAAFMTIAFVSALVLLRRPWARVAAFAAGALLAGAIGLTRLVLGVHWPTDVVAGWALGLDVALVATLVAVAYSWRSGGWARDNRELRQPAQDQTVAMPPVEFARRYGQS